MMSRGGSLALTSLALTSLALISPQQSARAQALEPLPSTSFELSWRGCTPNLQRELLTQLHALPPKLLRLNRGLPLEVSCAQEERPVVPYGFYIKRSTSQEGRDTLHLSSLPPLNSAAQEERAYYRLKGLSQEARELLWWRRGLTHVIASRALEREPSLINERFRLVNGWGASLTGGALNLDAWGYARAEGQESAEMDWLTSVEELLVPAITREPSTEEADNRALCQEFMKVRAIHEALYTTSAPLPAKRCRAFWRWVEGVGALELLWSAPTSSFISSFGHLSLIMRERETLEGEAFEGELTNLDTLFQFVGLLTGQEEGLNEHLSPPLVVSFEGASGALERERGAGRDVTRYPLTLSAEERVWLLAALWGRVRRFDGSYSFLRHNCTGALAQLIALALPKDKVKEGALTSRLTYAPLGLISALQAIGKLSQVGISEPSRVRTLSELRRWLHQERHSQREPQGDHQQSAQGRLPSPELTLSEALKAWTHLSERPLQERTWGALQRRYEALLAYLKLYDLEPWREERALEPPQLKLKASELLALKHQLFHVEKRAEESAALLMAWQEALMPHPQPLEQPLEQSPQANAQQLNETERLIELVEGELVRVKRALYQASPAKPITREGSFELEREGEREAEMSAQRQRAELSPTQRAIRRSSEPLSARLSPAWGGEQAYEVGAWLRLPSRALSVAVRAALYEEQRGRARHALSLGHGTRQLLELSALKSERLTALSVTPLRLMSAQEGARGSLRERLITSLELHLDLISGRAQPLTLLGGGSGGVGLTLLSWREGRGQLALTTTAQVRSDGYGALSALELLTPIKGKLSLNMSLERSLWGWVHPRERVARLISAEQGAVLSAQRPFKLTLSLQSELLGGAQRALWLSAGVSGGVSGGVRLFSPYIDRLAWLSITLYQ